MTKPSRKAPILALLLTLSSALLGAAAAPAQTAAPSLAPQIRAARFIFAGTVEKTGASNVDLLPASGQTALVRVREVIDQPQTMGVPAGTLVTLLLARPAGIRVGERAIFFANGWLYGENFAVREVARLADPGTPAAATTAEADRVRAAVAAVRRQVDDEALAARLASAAGVVAGRVAAVRPVARRAGEPQSEHTALWWQAEITVTAALKGTPGQPATAYFAHGGDELWLLSPKLKTGDEGIFLLHPYSGPDLPPGARVVVHPSDVQPETQRERVRRLLR